MVLANDAVDRSCARFTVPVLERLPESLPGSNLAYDRLESRLPDQDERRAHVPGTPLDWRASAVRLTGLAQRWPAQ
jgi:hypothetical protein